MADNIEEVNQTPPPAQPSADDNRRRTRSQTRNGGATPPVAAPEPRGRKRASQSQPGSGGKRGRKPAQPAKETSVEAQAEKQDEAHSKQPENIDLPKQKPAEVSVTAEADAKKDEDVIIRSEEEVVRRYDQAKEANDVVERENACKVRKVNKEQPEKQDNSSKEDSDATNLIQDQVSSEATDKQPTDTKIGLGAKTDQEGVKSDTKIDSVKTTAGDAPEKAPPTKVEGSKASNADGNEAPETTSEQHTQITNSEPAKDTSADEKTVNNTVEKGVEHNTKAKDSEESKVQTNDDVVKADGNKVSEQANSVTPV